MSKDQAETKAQQWTAIAKSRYPALNYRVREWGKRDGVMQYAVIQYLDDKEVGIAAS